MWLRTILKSLTANFNCSRTELWAFDPFFLIPQSPKERLGCHPETGFQDIQTNPFFKTINWEQLYSKQIIPPYKPTVKSEMDLEHFDPQFTNEPVQLTPDDMYVEPTVSFTYGVHCSALATWSVDSEIKKVIQWLCQCFGIRFCFLSEFNFFFPIIFAVSSNAVRSPS